MAEHLLHGASAPGGILTTGIVAWKSGRNFGTWHITGGDLWLTLCGLPVPTKPLSNVSRIRGEDRSPTCANCIRQLDRLTKESITLESA